jgi:two-component system, LytTR family, response regulator
MQKLRVLVVDDEPLARARIRTLLLDDADVAIIGECADGGEAVEFIEKHWPDLVFLDVQMPVLGGFEVVEMVGAESMPAVIFVTAYDQYALRAFDVNALDYLLKPFDRERFEKALKRAKAQIERAQNGDFNERLLTLLKNIKAEQKPLERLIVKSGGRVFFLRAEEIDWIESVGNYLRLHTGKESHLIRETMNRLEARLDSAKFLRIHRSTMVNIQSIKELRPGVRGEYEVILLDGTTLHLSRGYRDRLNENLKEML